MGFLSSEAFSLFFFFLNFFFTIKLKSIQSEMFAKSQKGKDFYVALKGSQIYSLLSGTGGNALLCNQKPAGITNKSAPVLP